jgi:hypothetical protein
MKNLIELRSLELYTVTGGATFAYRVGQLIRWTGFSALPGGQALIEFEIDYL